VAELLNAYGLAYLHIIEPRIKGVEFKPGLEGAANFPNSTPDLRPQEGKAVAGVLRGRAHMD
jgi:hypothetical protein